MDLEGYVADCGSSNVTDLLSNRSSLTFCYINFCGNQWNFLKVKLNPFQDFDGNKNITCLNMFGLKELLNRLVKSKEINNVLTLCHLE